MLSTPTVSTTKSNSLCLSKLQFSSILSHLSFCNRSAPSPAGTSVVVAAIFYFSSLRSALSPSFAAQTQTLAPRSATAAAVISRAVAAQLLAVAGERQPPFSFSRQLRAAAEFATTSHSRRCCCSHTGCRRRCSSTNIFLHLHLLSPAKHSTTAANVAAQQKLLLFTLENRRPLIAVAAVRHLPLSSLSAAVHCCSKHRRGLGLPSPPPLLLVYADSFALIGLHRRQPTLLILFRLYFHHRALHRRRGLPSPLW